MRNVGVVRALFVIARLMLLDSLAVVLSRMIEMLSRLGVVLCSVVPEARGEAERILQGARAYKEQTVAEATGQTVRFLKVYEEYKKAPEVTRTRMYLETMERVLGGTDKIILDSKGGQGVVPFLPLEQLQNKKR
jgi:regulator of protease activity HflC (stomatin/prohibitin superfamily)